MKLIELKSVIMEDVCIYKEKNSEEYEDLCTSRLSDVSQELLDSEVVVVGVNNTTKLLEIQIK